MSKIPFDPTTVQGMGRTFRSIFRPNLLTYWFLTAILCFSAAGVRAQDAVQGKRGRANFHSVINFRGAALLEQRHGTNTGPRHVVPQYPRSAPDFPVQGRDESIGAGPRQGGGVRSVPASPAPAAQGTVSPNSIDAVQAVTAGTGLPSPPMATSFPAIEDNISVIPPDTQGAVGPRHVMTTLNSQFRIQDRNGTNLSTMSFNAFWAAVGVTSLSDPHVVYDPYAGRWITTAIAEPFSPSSSVLVGASQTDDPLGSWNLYRVDADTNNLSWADYPTLGFNKDWIVVTATMFPNFFSFGQQNGVNIWVFNKTNLYTNGVGLFTFLQDNSGRSFTMVPAVTYDENVSTMYLVEVDQMQVNYFGSGNFLRLSTISGPVGNELLTLGTSFITATNAWFNSDPYLFGMLPQRSTNAFF